MKSHTPYIPAKFRCNGFNCPFCHAYAHQHWGMVEKVIDGHHYGTDKTLAICRCGKCGKFSVWCDEKMVFPDSDIAPPPNIDLPDDIIADYEEARSITSKSPRGAAALLRLCIQKLCRHLGEKGDNINDDIGSLVKKGLPSKVQKALDLVRVVGNNAVHPGQIDLDDKPDVASSLFMLVNIIADVMISQPNHVNELYDSILPESQKKAIDKRDGAGVLPEK